MLLVLSLLLHQSIVVLSSISLLNMVAHPGNSTVQWLESLHKNHSVNFLVRSYHKKINEYQEFIQPSMLKFHPNIPKENFIVILDKDSFEDKLVGERISGDWPYPRVEYREVENKIKAHEMQGGSYFYADTYVTDPETFIAMIDTDALFSSPVTKESMFDDKGKPYIISYIGNPQNPSWTKMPVTAAAILKERVWLRGMANFPVVVKAKHLTAMRLHIETKHKGTDFSVIWQTVRGPDGYLSAWCVIVNYLWFYHRTEYNFRFEKRDGITGPLTVTYDDENKAHMYKASLHDKEVQSWYTRGTSLPKPRIMVHAGYFPGLGHLKDGKGASPVVVQALIDLYDRGWCLSGGILSDPSHRFITELQNSTIIIWSQYCKKYSLKSINQGQWENIEYKFSQSNWKWDNRCLSELKKYYLQKWSYLRRTDGSSFAISDILNAQKQLGLI
jgi:hypothetical protein